MIDAAVLVRISLTAAAMRPSSSREAYVIGGVAGATARVRSPLAIAFRAPLSSVESFACRLVRQSEISLTPRRVETKKPANRKIATTPPRTR